MKRTRPSPLASRRTPLLLTLIALATAIALVAGPAAAQSLTAQNSATVTVQKELSVPGVLSESSGGTVTFDGGTLTLSGSDQQTVEIGPITVSGLTLDNASGAVLNSSVSVDSTLTLTNGVLTTNGNLTLTSDGEQDIAAIAGSGSGSVSGAVTFERFLDKSDDASHYRMLGAPTTTMIDDEGSGTNAGNLLSNMWTQAVGSGADAQVGEGSASVYDFDEGTNLGSDPPSAGWFDVENLDTTLNPGDGVLAFLFADRDPTDNTTEGFPATLTATGTVRAAENDGTAIAPSITYTDNDTQSKDGWNLIANPFMAPIDWESIENDGLTNVDKTIYVWDPSANSGNGAYATYTADGGGTNGQTQYLPPFQAFFVKANGSSPNVGGIEASDKATGETPEFKQGTTSPPRVTLRLRAEGDTTGEATALRYHEDALPGKDAYDAYQLLPLSSTYALVATEMAGAEVLFDHQNRPVPAAQDTVDLALDLTEDGTYTLAADSLAHLPADWSVILKNRDSGARYDLGAGETVMFQYEAPASEPVANASAPASPRAALQNGAPPVATAGGVATAGAEVPSFRLFVGPEAALPVEWAGFEARAQEQAVTLTWQTASETDNAGFAVQRRVAAQAQGGKGPSWERIGFVESKASGGTTSGPQRYQFADAEIPFEAERLTYRLRQEDLDGTATHSDRISVQLGAPSEARLHAPFPNPARRQATLRYEVPEGLGEQAVEIAVYDALGRRVRTVANGPAPAGRHELSLSTAALAPGMYFVRMRAGQHTQTHKLTVVR